MNPIREAKSLVKACYSGTGNWTKNYNRAQSLIESALQEDPRNTVLLTCLGAILSDQGEHKKAVVILKRAIKLGSEDANTYFNLAVASINSGSYNRAMKLFKQAGEFKARSQTWEAYFDPHGH